MAASFVNILAAFGAVCLLSGCGSAGSVPVDTDGALTWGTWGSYGRHKKFLDLVEKNCPDIELEFIPYTGGNSTGYSWVQMRADDISDIFITSQILDPELAKERLINLSDYSFVNDFSTALLDQVAIDGEVYLLPVSNAIYGIFYNKTLMEEKGWEVPENFGELEALCGEIRAEGLIPGVVGTNLTGDPFSAVFNLAKTDWLTTPEGIKWERDFRAGKAHAAGVWEGTMDYVQKYLDIGMFHTDPQDRSSPQLILDYLGNRKAVFCTAVTMVNITRLPDSGDELGLMPFISEDGEKNIYMYSPTFYFGISKRLGQPGNEEKLEKAVRILSLLFSPEGQAAFIDESSPCVMSVLGSARLPEESMIRDARLAMEEGRTFEMTYAGWEGILADVGQGYKEWFRGENDMDGPKCIARMDELQRNWLDPAGQTDFCENTADFTLEETARLVGSALGSAAGADAAMIPVGEFHEKGVELRTCISGKLYRGKINTEVIASISPGLDGEYAVMTMSGAQAKELARTGFLAEGDRVPFPYILVTRGDSELEDDRFYDVAFLMKGYTEETAEKFSVRVYPQSVRSVLRLWFEGKERVSPGEILWK